MDLKLDRAFPYARTEYSVRMAVEQKVDGKSVWTHVEIARVTQKSGAIRRIVETCHLEEKFPKDTEISEDGFVAKINGESVQVLQIVPVYVDCYPDMPKVLGIGE